eukprot:4590236-Prorocentrum_lima.AAC.1
MCLHKGPSCSRPSSSFENPEGGQCGSEEPWEAVLRVAKSGKTLSRARNIGTSSESRSKKEAA